MAVLETIRVKLGVLITILIAVALLSFIIDPNTLGSTIQMTSSSNDVGKMNGKSINYRDFYTEVENNSSLFEALGQNVNSEEAQRTLRDLTWQNYFDQLVFIPKTKKAGIFVGDEEMYDLTQGKTLSPVLTSQPMFADANGAFSREAFANFVTSIEYDESGLSARYEEFLENNILKQQLYDKYASLIMGSETMSTLEIGNAIAENNLTKDVDFVMVPAGYAVDSSIVISNDEIKKYYNDRKQQFRAEANRDIEYVMFEVVPSQADIDAFNESFDDLYQQFQQSDNLKNFVSLNSDFRWRDFYFSEADLAATPEFAQIVAKGEGVSEIVVNDNTHSAARVVDVKSMPDSVNVSYTFLPLTEEAQVDSIYSVLKNKGVYEEMTDMWFTQAMVESNGLSELGQIFTMPKGNVAKIKLANMGAYAIVKILDTTKPIKKAKLAVLSKSVTPSDETYRDFLMQATSLADRSEGKYDKFAAIVSEENLPVIPATHITEATRRLGVVDNARAVVNWAFDKKTKKGKVSDVITVDNKYYFVAAVTETRKEGYVNINEVASSIRTTLMYEKKSQKLAEEVSSQINSSMSLEEIAETLGTTVSHQAGVAFGSSTASLDPKFIGAISNAQAGVVTGPIAGDIAVYIFKVTDSQNGSYFTEADAVAKAQQNGAYHLQMLTSIITEEAKVKDNRARFF